MAAIYRTLLREIEADGFQVLHQRISLTPLRKLWIATRTHLRGRAVTTAAAAPPSGGGRRAAGPAGRSGRRSPTRATA